MSEHDKPIQLKILGNPFRGPQGESAYEVAVRNGYRGTEAEWLEYLHGGPQGQTGRSAYQVAVMNGFNGTEAEWVESLKADGDMLGKRNLSEIQDRTAARTNIGAASQTDLTKLSGTVAQVSDIADQANQKSSVAIVDSQDAKRVASTAYEAALDAGRSIVVNTRAELNALPGLFPVNSRAEVRNDPAGNVTNGNGIYRFKDNAWVWIDGLIGQGTITSITQTCVAAAETTANNKVSQLANHVQSLIVPSEELYISLTDENGFQREFLTPQRLNLPTEDILTEHFDIIGDTPHFQIQDEHGYVGFILGTDFLPETVNTSNFQIGTSELIFGVGDENGYFPLYLPHGESIVPTSALERRITQLENGSSGGGGKTWPRIQTAGIPISAHRGVWEGTPAPENSIDALRLAARLGYKVAETDVRMTGDSKYVIIHDDTINRTMRRASDYGTITDPVRVINSTLSDLHRDYVLASSDEAMRRHLPTMQEYLIEAKTLGIKPILEIKDDSITLTQVTNLVHEAIDVLGWDGVIFTSFNQGHLDHIRTLNADVALYYILHFNSQNIDHTVSKNGTINVSVDLLTESLIKEAHRKGIKVACWTAQPKDFDKYIRMGVDELTTNMIAPPLTDQAVIWSCNSGPDWSGWTTNGTVSKGTIRLEAGQTLVLDEANAKNVDLGGWYLSLEYLGAVRITANGLNHTDDRIIYAMATRCFQNRFSGKANLTITAGTGGATIKTAAFAVAEY